MYRVIEWKDEIVDQNTGVVIQEGTLQSAANFNTGEYGTEDAQAAFAIFLQYYLQYEREARAKNVNYEAEFLNEVQTITLTNSQKFPFNNSLYTVSLVTPRKTLNYDVSWEVTTANGNVGDITVTDKQLNGFKIAFDGSATSVTLKIRIKGGMLV
ncbi:hypothetical protein [Tepidibacillus marianensis]|uniref:hypothetical protein n=1 Tax=Tepidibacillus marianensis TaxID=3131995 RepID=UPI0030D1E9BC